MEDFGKCIIRTGDEVLSTESRQQFRALKKEIDRAMRDMIEDAIGAGSAQVDDVRLTAFTLAGALNWPARWYRADGDHAPEAVARTLVVIQRAGLNPARQPARLDSSTHICPYSKNKTNKQPTPLTNN